MYAAILEILRRLPGTNCRKCGQTTCMVFAALVMESGRRADHCPELTIENRERLETYLNDFSFE